MGAKKTLCATMPMAIFSSLYLLQNFIVLINLNDIFPSCFLDAIECTADDLIRDSPRFQNQAISVNWLGLKTLLHILKSTRKCARVFVPRTSEK